tara:strand:- start:29028 stop:30062 length:1035 start_codon:yes stop_codon:yes gene_type:complete
MAEQPDPQESQELDQGSSSGQPQFVRPGTRINESFIFHDGKNYQHVWDSTSLGLLKECPYKYYLTMIHGWVPRTRSHHLIFGIHVHEALEAYDFARAMGDSYEAGVIAALRYCLTATGTHDEAGVFTPWLSDDPTGYKTRESLTRTIAWHLTQFEHDMLKTVILSNGKPAVELSFRMELSKLAPHGEPYVLSGHLDKLAEIPGDGIWVVDHKTTKNTIGEQFFTQFSPNNQISLYANAGRVVYSQPIRGVIINGIQIAKGFVRSMRSPVHRTKSQLDDWMLELNHYISLAEQYTNWNYFPMNDKSCFLCHFKSICSKDKTVRATFLAADFTQHHWNPAQSRNAE